MTTLRAFLEAHPDARFAWRGEIVRCQRLTDHYSSYLEAAVEAESDDVWFSSMTQRSHAPVFTVLAERENSMKQRTQNVRRRLLETFTRSNGDRVEALSCGHQITVEEYHETDTVICPDCTENRAERLKEQSA